MYCMHTSHPQPCCLTGLWLWGGNQMLTSLSVPITGDLYKNSTRVQFCQSLCVIRNTWKWPSSICWAMPYAHALVFCLLCSPTSPYGQFLTKAGSKMLDSYIPPGPSVCMYEWAFSPGEQRIFVSNSQKHITKLLDCGGKKLSDRDVLFTQYLIFAMGFHEWQLASHKTS